MKSPSTAALSRALLIALTLPLTTLAQTPVKAPTVLPLDPKHGFCDAKYVPLTVENAPVVFAETEARAGVVRFFSTIGKEAAGHEVVRMLVSGEFFRKSLNPPGGLAIDPNTIFAAYSGGRDGSVYPFVQITPTTQLTSGWVTPVGGTQVFLFSESCAIGVRFPAFDPTKMSKVGFRTISDKEAEALGGKKPAPDAGNVRYIPKGGGTGAPTPAPKSKTPPTVEAPKPTEAPK